MKTEKNIYDLYQLYVINSIKYNLISKIILLLKYDLD